jgi:hypothetical protein
MRDIYYLLPTAKRTNFGTRAHRALFLDYGTRTLGYLLLVLDSRTFVHDVKFYKSLSGGDVYFDKTSHNKRHDSDEDNDDIQPRRRPQIIPPPPHPTAQQALPVLGPNVLQDVPLALQKRSCGSDESTKIYPFLI